MKITSILLFVFTSLASWAQEESKVYQRFKYRTGYKHGTVTLISGEEVQGMIKRTKSPYASADLKLVTKAGRKINLMAMQTMGYKIGSSSYLQIEGEFYKVEVEGDRLNLYSQEMANSWTVPGANGMMMTHSNSFTGYFVLRKEEIEPSYVPSGKRKFIEFAEIFSDCPELFTKIQNKELVHDDIKKIIKTYNSCE